MNAEQLPSRPAPEDMTFLISDEGFFCYAQIDPQTTYYLVFAKQGVPLKLPRDCILRVIGGCANTTIEIEDKLITLSEDNPQHRRGILIPSQPSVIIKNRRLKFFEFTITLSENQTS